MGQTGQSVNTCVRTNPEGVRHASLESGEQNVEIDVDIKGAITRAAFRSAK